MSFYENHNDDADPFSGIAIDGPQDFMLLGSELVVPLHFKPASAFIVMTVLHTEVPFKPTDILQTVGFQDVCEGDHPDSRYHTLFTRITFTFDALKSTLIQRNSNRAGFAHMHQRNPNYEIIDRR